MLNHLFNGAEHPRWSRKERRFVRPEATPAEPQPRGAPLTVWAPEGPTRYDAFSLTRFPAFWEGCIATRKARIAEADDPQRGAVDRSEKIIARMTGEQPIPGGYEAMAEDERYRHDVALTRLELLRDAAVQGADVTALPEFAAWLAGGMPPPIMGFEA